MASGAGKLMTEDLPKLLVEYKASVLHLIDIYRQLGLSNNVEDALAELHLLIAVVQAHNQYLMFKKKQLELRKGDSS